MTKTLTIVTVLALFALAGPAAAGEHAPFFSSSGSGGSFLGVELADLDDAAVADLGVRGSGGVQISRVIEESAAAEAGLEDGDVLLSLDGERVRSAAHLGRLVRETAPGRTVELEVLREGREHTIEARLRERASAPLFFGDRPLHAPMPAMPWMPAVPAMPAMPAIAPLVEGVLHQAFQFRGAANWRLGIHCDDLSGQLAEFFDVEQGAGVLVERVVEGSAAETAGLRAGDVIVGLDDERIHSASELRTLLADDERDAAAALVIVRKGRERSLPVELEKVERSGAFLFGGDDDAIRDLRERYAEQAEEWAGQAELWRAQQGDARRESEEQARELQRHAREQQRELHEQQRQLQHQLRDAQRSLRHATPAPIAAPAPMLRSSAPTPLPL